MFLKFMLLFSWLWFTKLPSVLRGCDQSTLANYDCIVSFYVKSTDLTSVKKYVYACIATSVTNFSTIHDITRSKHWALIVWYPDFIDQLIGSSPFILCIQITLKKYLFHSRTITHLLWSVKAPAGSRSRALAVLTRATGGKQPLNIPHRTTEHCRSRI